jgi:hypothetical protein
MGSCLRRASECALVNPVVKAMVTVTEDALASAVKDGTLTQAQADKMKTSLTQLITNHVNGVRPVAGPGHGPRGSGPPPLATCPAGCRAPSRA